MGFAKWTIAAVLATAFATTWGVGPALADPTPTASSGSKVVTEYYNGKTYTLSPDNWHGAKDCAIDSPTVAHCFDTDAQFAAYTSSNSTSNNSAASTSSAQAAPAAASCNGYVKIWDGANFTNRGLAFKSIGTQPLSDYASVPFGEKSWFTDGQRGYAPMTNCIARLLGSQTQVLVNMAPNSEALDLGNARPGYYINIASA